MIGELGPQQMVLAQQVCCSYAAGVGNSVSRCERMRGVVVQCIQVETNYSRRGPFERRAGQKRPMSQCLSYDPGAGLLIRPG